VGSAPRPFLGARGEMGDRSRTSLRLGLYSAYIVLASLILVEIGLRVMLVPKIGPSVLLYGTSASRDVRAFERDEAQAEHREMEALRAMKRHLQVENSAWTADRHLSSYAKYHPNQKRVDFDRATGERFDVRINRQGFRGEDFENSKKPDTLRVVTLGASSTFGYYSRDHQTYPFVLEQELGKRCPQVQFEVINLGIPHLSIAQIVALFLTEGIPLSPDVVTFYEGVNDSLLVRPAEEEESAARRAVAALREKLLLIALVDTALDLRNLRWSQGELRERSQPVADDFVAGLEALRAASEANGARFVLISQQAKSSTIERKAMKGLRYRDEVKIVTDRMNEGRSLGGVEVAFLAHSRLMDRSRDWATDGDVAYVDGIAQLDTDRDVLLSWVHLSPRGNRLLADAIANRIIDLTCSADAVAQPLGD
jgi:lysophospholipase L1-like esterase